MHKTKPPDIERYRRYLRVLADMQMGPRIRTKEGVSDVVQATMLQAHAAASDFRGTTEAELKAWLKTILSNTLVNLAKKYHAKKRDFRLTSTREIRKIKRSVPLNDWTDLSCVTLAASD